MTVPPGLAGRFASTIRSPPPKAGSGWPALSGARHSSESKPLRGGAPIVLEQETRADIPRKTGLIAAAGAPPDTRSSF
jgi:hypothetical protein